MIKFLKKVYHKYSDTRVVRWLGNVYRNGFFLSNYAAYLRLKKFVRKKRPVNNKIKVVFLCQYAQVWNKLKSVYEKMEKDDRYSVLILAIPEDITNVDDKIYNYFFEKYGTNVINAYQNGQWYDLKSINADYIFYQRPYDQYLPREYRSAAVSGYAKICHVVYGYQVAVTTESSCMNRLFFRNVYMYFAENAIYHKFNINRFKKSHKDGIRKTLNIGYPSLEDFMKHKDDVKESRDNVRVLWTPRWSEDKENGGSNFMTFKDEIVKLPEADDRIQVVFRPHPMTFKHFISVNRITEKEVNEYLNIYENNENLIYHSDMEYAELFWDSDILLTDVSTVIVEYFLTGKPIVYCDTGSKPNEFMKEMLKVFYVVNTWEEAKSKVLELVNGEDPLKEERNKKISELLGADFEHISDRFLETICEDYKA